MEPPELEPRPAALGREWGSPQICSRKERIPAKLRLQTLLRVAFAERQHQGKDASFSGCTLDFDLAAVVFGDVFHQRKAKARLRNSAIMFFGCAIEAFEYALGIARVNSDSLVLNGHGGFAIGPARLQLEPPLFG